MIRRTPKADPSAAAVAAAHDFPRGIAGRPWRGLYVGDGVDPATGTEVPTYAGPESSMMVLGPPRCGKTSAIVVPCVLDAPAAVVSTSTKPDVLSATLWHRYALGNCFVFDPSGSMTIPAGAHLLRWSPITGCEQFDRAVSVAHAMASAARPRAALSESAHWIERAEALLAPLLFAAAQRGKDITTLCRWVMARDLREPLAVLAEAGDPMAEATLAGVAATEDRERSGIFSTGSGLLAAYRSQAALASATEPNFDPTYFVQSTDSVYICAPAQAQDQLAPLIVALLDQVRDAVYARPTNAAPVVFALDEVAGIAPLPSLPALAAEGGGQGLVTLACLQDLSQARARWGEAAEGFFSLFHDKLIFPGIGDHRTLQLISALAGDGVVLTRSYNRPAPFASLINKSAAVGSTTTSQTFRPNLPVDEVARGRPGHALCISGAAMAYAKILPWWQHEMWNRRARSQLPYGTEITRPNPSELAIE
jgi:type IV secretion system protein VirD4